MFSQYEHRLHGSKAGLFNADASLALRPAAEELMRSETVRKIGFTGSTRVGKLLMKQAADTVKKVCPAFRGHGVTV